MKTKIAGILLNVCAVAILGSGVTFASPIVQNYGKLPLSFIENRGQVDARAKFIFSGPQGAAFFTKSGVTFNLQAPSASWRHDHKRPFDRHRPDLGIDPILGDAIPYTCGQGDEDLRRMGITLPEIEEPEVRKGAVLKMELVGISPDCRIEGTDRLEGKVNYLIGSDQSKWHTDVPTYSGVAYRNAWPGIDCIYHGEQHRLKYDVRIAPGADISQIRIRYTGADKLWLDDSGDLHIQTAAATFVEHVPGIYQQSGSKKRYLIGGYMLIGKNTIRFRVEGYDPSLPLVIDPASDLVWSTFLGGTNDSISAIAVDARGCAYVTGSNCSPDFPTTAGAFCTTMDGIYNVFVTKLNASGSSLVYSTLFGGCVDDRGRAIAIDAAGCAYVTGTAESFDFPTTAGAFCRIGGGGFEGCSCEAFVTKLNASGSGLVYSTFLGGSGGPWGAGDYGNAIAVDAGGSAYVIGSTCSSNFPTTPGAFCRTLYTSTGNYSCFVTKFNSSGSGLVYSTFLGGSICDEGSGIAVDGDCCAYATGSTASPDFPTTAEACQTAFGGWWDAFVTKLNSSGGGLVYSTLLGGSEKTWAMP